MTGREALKVQACVSKERPSCLSAIRQFDDQGGPGRWATCLSEVDASVLAPNLPGRRSGCHLKGVASYFWQRRF